MGTPNLNPAVFIDGFKSPEQLTSEFIRDQASKGGWNTDVTNAALGAVAGLFRPTGAVPDTRVRLTHALTLKIGTRVIGAVHKLAPTMRRAVDREPEVDVNGVGLYAAIIPQMMDGDVRLSRYDLYLSLLEDVVGTREIVVLTDQSVGLILRETWRGPAGVGGGGVRMYDYLDCYFTDLGRSLDASGDRVSGVDATLAFRTRRRIR